MEPIVVLTVMGLAEVDEIGLRIVFGREAREGEVGRGRGKVLTAAWRCSRGLPRRFTGGGVEELKMEGAHPIDKGKG